MTTIFCENVNFNNWIQHVRESTRKGTVVIMNIGIAVAGVPHSFALFKRASKGVILPTLDFANSAVQVGLLSKCGDGADNYALHVLSTHDFEMRIN